MAEQRPRGRLRRARGPASGTQTLCSLGGHGQHVSVSPQRVNRLLCHSLLGIPDAAIQEQGEPFLKGPHRPRARDAIINESSPARNKQLVVRTTHLCTLNIFPPEQESPPPLPVSRGPPNPWGMSGDLWADTRSPPPQSRGVEGRDPCFPCPFRGFVGEASGTGREVLDSPIHQEATPDPVGGREGASHSPGRSTQHSHDLIKDVLTHDVTIGEQHLIHLAGRGLPDLGRTEHVSRRGRPVRTQAE